MRIIVQRVKQASVTINGEKISEIGKGFLLLVGLTPGDTPELASKMAQKVSKLRIFEDENGKTNLDLASVGGSILSVSQFTLYGSAREGNRPSFVNAMRPEEAKGLYQYFYNELGKYVPSLQNGVFGADMKVELLNDGPFTLILDSKELFA